MAGCEAGDEWLFDSLQRYESLHMFELQYPTKCMEWACNGSAVCVAGFSTEHPNELLQLALPEKLLPLQQQSLCARRDMKILRGAFSKSPITGLKYIDAADLIASAGFDTSVCLWEADSESSDMLSKAAEISLSTSQPSPPSTRQLLLDWTPALPAAILVGTSLQSVQLLDIHTHKALFEFRSGSSSSPSPLLHGLNFAGHDTTSFVTCTGDAGHLHLWDTRTAEAGVRVGGVEERRLIEPETKGSPDRNGDFSSGVLKEPQAANWSQAGTMDSSRSGAELRFAFAVSGDAYPDSRFAVVGESGHLALYEARTPGRPCAECSVLSASSDVVVRTRFTTGHEALCVKFSPGNSHWLSLSGVTRGVAVYDTSKWTRDMKGRRLRYGGLVPQALSLCIQAGVCHPTAFHDLVVRFLKTTFFNCEQTTPTPLFTHTGHEEEFPGARILVHSWHPHLANTVLSVDSEGSLHAWQWKQG